MPFFDFDQIKKDVSLLQAAELLGLDMKKNGNQLRGPCPACEKGGDRALVITEGKGWFCFSAKTGGDVIALVAHVRNVAAKDAAAWLSKGTVPETVPKKEEASDSSSFKPLDYLEHAHESVIALGFDADEARQLGIGYASKGLLRGYVAIPVYLPDGRLSGYVGVQDVKLPTQWHHITTKVVSLDKKRA